VRGDSADDVLADRDGTDHAAEITD